MFKLGAKVKEVVGINKFKSYMQEQTNEMGKIADDVKELAHESKQLREDSSKLFFTKEWEELVIKSKDYLKKEYSDPLTDKEMDQLSELLHKIQYCDEYRGLMNRRVEWFITQISASACVARGNMAKERSKEILDKKILDGMSRESAQE